MAEHRITYQDENGVRRTMILDDERPDRVIVKTEQVLDEILDGVQRDRELINPRSDIRRVAKMPIEAFERSIREGWGPDDDARWLNSSEAAPFRVWRGRV